MARVVVSTYLVRSAVGGMASCFLQFVVGLHRAGHEVYVVEQAGYPNASYDPATGVMGNDCTHGVAIVSDLLGRYGLGDRWAFVDWSGRCHGMSRDAVASVFATADVFIDSGGHAEWDEESLLTGARVYIDGEPGFRQMDWERRSVSGDRFDAFFTVGRNIGTALADAPTAGLTWRPLFPPVDTESFPVTPSAAAAPYSTVMSWQAHEPMQWRGRTYGQKDVEFARFLDLPSMVAPVPVEIAVSGAAVPTDVLLAAGWRVRGGAAATPTFDSYVDYLQSSRGEFGVCKNVFVATNSAWFSDRSAAYLASGRPVVIQDTGFSAHLPCGEGLFAVTTVDEAADAIDQIERDWDRHSKAARAIAEEYLDAAKVMGGLMDEVEA